MTAAEIGWGDPGADPPHEWERAHSRLEEVECALAGMVSENNELRAIVRLVRDHACWQRQMAEELCVIGELYQAIPYLNTAKALERILGDQP